MSGSQEKNAGRALLSRLVGDSAKFSCSVLLSYAQSLKWRNVQTQLILKCTWMFARRLSRFANLRPKHLSYAVSILSQFFFTYGIVPCASYRRSIVDTAYLQVLSLELVHEPVHWTVSSRPKLEMNIFKSISLTSLPEEPIRWWFEFQTRAERSRWSQSSWGNSIWEARFSIGQLRPKELS